MTNKLVVKRIYEPPDPGDGLRVLVDRIWPRGMSKEKAQTDLWLKDAAPSQTLCKWFGHDRAKWEEFKTQYFSELDAHPQAVSYLLEETSKGQVTLLYSARDEDCNQAVALKEYLDQHSRS